MRRDYILCLCTQVSVQLLLLSGHWSPVKLRTSRTLELHSGCPMGSRRGSCCSLCMHSGFKSAGNFLCCHCKHIRHSHTLCLFFFPFLPSWFWSFTSSLCNISQNFTHHQSWVTFTQWANLTGLNNIVNVCDSNGQPFVSHISLKICLKWEVDGSFGDNSTCKYSKLAYNQI